MAEKVACMQGGHVELKTTAALVRPDGRPKMGIQVKAGRNNVGQIWLGNSDVSPNRGYPLEPGENIFLPLDNTALLYAVAENEGDTAYYLLL